MYIGNNLINNGDGVKVGASQVTKVLFGATQVWVNNYAPTAPTNFVASADKVGYVKVTWTNSADEGVPTCTYDLYENDIKVATNIAPDYLRDVSSGTRTYYIRATNVAGYSNSNTAIGTSKALADTTMQVTDIYNDLETNTGFEETV